ncbi:MAG: LON peptidase substrate-binding domain-containing protein [Bacteroidota bacterium]
MLTYVVEELTRIPIFPLNILPLPGEHIPLHIFEMRYRELLLDAEEKEIDFGILYAHDTNKSRIGSLVQLESVIKKYDTGESDIVVKCIDTFILSKFYPRLSGKLYPGGEVFFLNAMDEVGVSAPLKEEFEEYMELRRIKLEQKQYNIHDVANELDLDTHDRLKYLKLLTVDKRNSFVKERLQFRRFVLEQELSQKDTFYLN